MFSSTISEQIIVTGASGFIGKAVVRLLAAQGRNVLGVARTPVEGLPTTLISNYKETPSGDVLIHLAEDSDRRRVNAAGGAYENQATANLRSLLNKRYNRIVYVSSAMLYGDAGSELHLPDDSIYITDSYTRVKRHSELAVLSSGRGSVIRLTNIYGPGMARNNVVSTILKQLPGNGTITVWDNTPVRDFLWLEDAAGAIAAMALTSGHSGTLGVFNVGSGKGVSIRDLAELALEIAGCPERLVESTRPEHRFSCLVVDIKRTQAILGWQPRTGLYEGLEELIHQNQTP